MNKSSKDVFKLVDERLLAQKVLVEDPNLIDVRRIGVDSQTYRASVGLPSVPKDVQAKHNHYVHQLGVDVLRTLLSEAKLQEIEKEKQLKKQTKVGQLLRRRVKVTDFADGGVSISIEQDWDTSSWNDSLIEAGCEALLMVFQDLSEISSEERKERALQMLQKLLSRHKTAEAFLRKNMEMLIVKATSHLIRRGVSGGVLNLMWVLNGTKDNFLVELSNYKFNGRAMDMLLIEAKIAAILIQHTFRAKGSKKQLLLEEGFEHIKGFGTDKERYYRKLRVINSRSSELRAFWRTMHNYEGRVANARSHSNISHVIGGMRGPIHIHPHHVTLTLQTLAYLVSDYAASNAHGNREDIIRSQGCILLSSFLACPASPFSSLAAKILSEISKVSESFAPLVHAGGITAAFRYMKYVRTVHDIGQKVVVKHLNYEMMMGLESKVSRGGSRASVNARNMIHANQKTNQKEQQMLLAFLNCFDIIINTAIHASGLYRAYHNYDYITPAYGTTESIDYMHLLNKLYAETGFTTSIADYIKRKHMEINNKHKINPQDNPVAENVTTVASSAHAMKGGYKSPSVVKNMDKILQEITFLLSNNYLLQELSTIIMSTQQYSIVKKALLCILTLLSSHAHIHIVEIITAKGGKLMIKLIEFLDHEDHEVSSLSLLIFLQCNTLQTSRQSLYIVHINKYLIDLQQRSMSAKNAQSMPSIESSRPSTSNTNVNHEYMYIQNDVFSKCLLVSLTLSRQFDWRFYDIRTLYQQALTSNPAEDFTKQSIYINLLITMKVVSLDGKKINQDKIGRRLSRQYTSTHLLDQPHQRDPKFASLDLPKPPQITPSNVLSLSISDWILIPNNFELCLSMSKQLFIFSIQPLMFYLLHPQDIYYYEKLPLHESIAVCEILEGLSAYSKTALALYHSSSVLFLMKFIYLNKYLFMGKEMPGVSVIMLFHGIKSTFTALGRMCVAICHETTADLVEEYVSLMKQHEFLYNAMFFLDTLSVFDPNLPLEILQMQKEVGICVVEYFSKYARMLNFVEYNLKKKHVGSIEDLYDIAKQLVQILYKLHETYQIYFQHHPDHEDALRSEEVHIHSVLCHFLATMTTHKGTAFMSLTDWKIQPALLRYMPPPLSGFPAVVPVRESNSSSAYALELLELPHNFFLLCSHLCQMDTGLAFCLASGFLRRALDKVHLLHHRLNEHKATAHTQQFLALMQWDDRKLDYIGCLKFIATMASYHHAEHGSANDLIFSSLYDIVLICKEILNLKIPRDEEVIHTCYECLVALARDTLRVNPIFEKHDILSLVQKELYLCDRLPTRTAKEATDIIHFACRNISTTYIINMIPLIRESLGKVARIYNSKLDDSIRKAHWTLTRAAMIYKATVDSSYEIVEEESMRKIHLEIEEYIRTGKNLNNISVEELTAYYQDMDVIGSQVGTADQKGKKTRQSSSFTSAYMQRLALEEGTIDALRKHPHKKMNYYSTLGAEVKTVVRTPKGEKEVKGQGEEESSAVSSREMASQDSILGEIDPGEGEEREVMKKPLSLPGRLLAGGSKPATPSKRLLSPLAGGEGADELGHYSHCGVTSCGSLKLPPLLSPTLSPGPTEHGLYRPLSASERERLGLSLPLVPDPLSPRLVLSQLSARGEEFQRLVKMRKGKGGFMEIEKTPLSPYRSEQKGSGKKKRAERGEKGVERTRHGNINTHKSKKLGGGERETEEGERDFIPLFDVEEIPELKFTRPPPK